MADKRSIEVFTAGCFLCEEALATVRELACPSCEIEVYDLTQGCATGECKEKAKNYGVTSVPAVVVDGKLAECCARGPVSREALTAAGVGRPL